MLLWIDKKMDWLAPVSGKRGRAEKFSDAAIQFCLMVKNRFGLALRQFAGMVASLLKLSGLDWPMPDYTTLCRRQQRLQSVAMALMTPKRVTPRLPSGMPRQLSLCAKTANRGKKTH